MISTGCLAGQVECAPTPGCPTHDEILARTGLTAGIVIERQAVSDVELDCEDICSPAQASFGLLVGSYDDEVLRSAADNPADWTFSERSFVATPASADTYTICFPESTLSEIQAGQREFAARCSEFLLPEQQVTFATIREHFSTGILLSNKNGDTIEKSREDRALTVDLR